MIRNSLIIRPGQGADGKETFEVCYLFEAEGAIGKTCTLCYMPTLSLACGLVRYLNGGEMTKDEREMIDVAFRRSIRRKNAHGTDKQKPNT